MLKRIALLGFFVFASAATGTAAAPSPSPSPKATIGPPTAPAPQGLCPIPWMRPC